MKPREILFTPSSSSILRDWPSKPPVEVSWGVGGCTAPGVRPCARTWLAGGVCGGAATPGTLPPGAAARSPQLGGPGRRPLGVRPSRPPAPSPPRRILGAPHAPGTPTAAAPSLQPQGARRGPDRTPTSPCTHRARAPHPTPSPVADRLPGRAQASRAARAEAPEKPRARTWRPGRTARGAQPPALERRSLGASGAAAAAASGLAGLTSPPQVCERPPPRRPSSSSSSNSPGDCQPRNNYKRKRRIEEEEETPFTFEKPRRRRSHKRRTPAEAASPRAQSPPHRGARRQRARRPGTAPRRPPPHNPGAGARVTLGKSRQAGERPPGGALGGSAPSRWRRRGNSSSARRGDGPRAQPVGPSAPPTFRPAGFPALGPLPPHLCVGKDNDPCPAPLTVEAWNSLCVQNIHSALDRYSLRAYQVPGPS